MTVLTVDDVYAYCDGICFKTGPPGTVGAETEWFVVDPLAPHRHITPRTWQALLEDSGLPNDRPLPHGGLLTVEPGGQLEVSSAPHGDLSSLIHALRGDLGLIRDALARGGLALDGIGVDPARPPRLQTEADRYRCMSAYFGADGLDMMCTTASVQVCLDIGADAADAAGRWRLANLLSPVLTAAFANSPLHANGAGPYRRTGWKSTRPPIWNGLDAGRTAAPSATAAPGRAWADYVLDARVMMVRADGGRLVPAPDMTFRQWLASGADGRRAPGGTGGADGTRPAGPTVTDLEYHLTTLFPPVRPRGWLELRMIDALPDPFWVVAVALTTALIDDPEAAAEAGEAVAALRPAPRHGPPDGNGAAAGAGHGAEAEAEHELGLRAAREALADPALAAAARRCFEAAAPALHRLGAGDLLPVFEDYHDRFVRRGRTPADDVLDGIASWSPFERTAA